VSSPSRKSVFSFRDACPVCISRIAKQVLKRSHDRICSLLRILAIRKCNFNGRIPIRDPILRKLLAWCISVLQRSRCETMQSCARLFIMRWRSAATSRSDNAKVAARMPLARDYSRLDRASLRNTDATLTFVHANAGYFSPWRGGGARLKRLAFRDGQPRWHHASKRGNYRRLNARIAGKYGTRQLNVHAHARLYPAPIP